MARTHDSMISPQIEDLLGRVDSKFSLVTLAARRARMINSYFGQLGDGLGTAIPPQVTSVARKPLSIAFEEIAADKIRYERPDPETLEDEELDEATSEQIAAGAFDALVETVEVVEVVEVVEPAEGDPGA